MTDLQLTEGAQGARTFRRGRRKPRAMVESLEDQ